MAIKRDTVLLPTGAYDLDARVPAPRWLLNLRQGDYSLHHVLPYRYPQFLGFLAESYRTRLVEAGAQALWPAGAADRRSQIVAELRAMVSPRGAQERTLPNQFAWMGVNVFEGPAAEFRIDDPGAYREANKPISMSKDLWREIISLGLEVDKLAALSGAGGNTAMVRRNITIEDFDDVLYRLSPLMLRRSGGALMFNENDWVCVSTSVPRFQPPRESITAGVRNVFRAFALGNPKKLLLYKPDTRPAAATVPIFWRLRLDIENVPTDVFQAPRTQP